MIIGREAILGVLPPEGLACGRLGALNDVLGVLRLGCALVWLGVEV